VIQQSIDEGIIVFDDIKYQWKYKDEDHVILELLAHHANNKLEHLEKYLLENEKEYAYIERSLKANPALKEAKAIGEEPVKAEPDDARVKLYESLGLTVNDNALKRKAAIKAKAKELGLTPDGNISELEQLIINTQK
jgi:hypothetical protein